MNIKSKIMTKLQVWASAYLLWYLNPRYKELGKVMEEAFEAARPILPDVIHHTEGMYSMGGFMGYYRHSQLGRIAYSYLPDEERTKQQREVAQCLSMMLYYADKWTGNQLNPPELEYTERFLREQAARVHELVNS